MILVIVLALSLIAVNFLSSIPDAALAGIEKLVLNAD